MPNYCETDMFVYGESADLRKFVAGLKRDEKGKFSILDSYYPMPEDIRNTDSPVRIVTEEEKAAILAKRAGDPISAHPLTQAEYDQLIAKYGCGDWYEWARKYWGSKWGDFEDKITEGDEEEPWTVAISFESAWCFPDKGLDQVVKQFPSLNFSFYSYERGMEFQEGREYQGGSLVETWSHKYHGTRGG